jgi:hypothetical protein
MNFQRWRDSLDDYQYQAAFLEFRPRQNHFLVREEIALASYEDLQVAHISSQTMQSPDQANDFQPTTQRCAGCLLSLEQLGPNHNSLSKTLD